MSPIVSTLRFFERPAGRALAPKKSTGGVSATPIPDLIWRVHDSAGGVDMSAFRGDPPPLQRSRMTIFYGKSTVLIREH